MLKGMNAAGGTVGNAEEKSDKSSRGHVLSVWSRKAVLAGMIFSSALLAEKAYSAINTSGNVSAQATLAAQGEVAGKQLAATISRAKIMKVEFYNKGVAFEFPKKSKERISYSEFEKACSILKSSNMTGTIDVYLFELPMRGSRRVGDEIAKKGELRIRVEKRELGRILNLTKTGLSYTEAKYIIEKYLLKRLGNEKLLFFDYSDKYPEECRDYVDSMVRDAYNISALSIFFHGPSKFNTGIGSESKKRLQLLATRIVKAEYGEKRVSPEEAVIALNKWVSNNIIYSEMGANIPRTYSNALGAIWLGSGVCTDMANLLGVMCNSIGIPATPTFIGKRTLRNMIAGGEHAVTEVYLEGKGWVVFDPTNRCYFMDEYYTHETYYKVLQIIMDNVNPKNIIWNVSRPIKE